MCNLKEAKIVAAVVNGIKGLKDLIKDTAKTDKKLKRSVEELDIKEPTQVQLRQAIALERMANQMALNTEVTLQLINVLTPLVEAAVEEAEKPIPVEIHENGKVYRRVDSEITEIYRYGHIYRSHQNKNYKKKASPCPYQSRSHQEYQGIQKTRDSQ